MVLGFLSTLRARKQYTPQKPHHTAQTMIKDSELDGGCGRPALAAAPSQPSNCWCSADCRKLFSTEDQASDGYASIYKTEKMEIRNKQVGTTQSFKISGHMPFPPETFFNVQADLLYRPSWDEHIASVNGEVQMCVVQKDDSNSELCYWQAG